MLSAMRMTVVVVAVLVVGTTGAAAAAGYGPLADVAADAPGVDEVRSALDASGGSGAQSQSSGGGGDGSGGGSSGGSGGSDADSGGGSPPPFTIEVASIEECGKTCRDVTLRVTNERNATATGVSVDACIYAGKRDDDGDQLWHGRDTLGSLAPGESVTVERRVELGYVDAAKIKNNDGWVTVRTTVTGDDAEATFVSEEQVA